MEIQIPSPSVFLKRSPVLSATLPTTAKKPAKPRGNLPAKPPAKTSVTTNNASALNGGITKPKQSKSRNGCMTCKKKRLKCDETKPTCVQCEKRNVECEGYKKDYKWRTFEETNKNSRAGKVKKPAPVPAPAPAPANNRPVPETQDIPKPTTTASSKQQTEPWSPSLQHAFTSAAHAITRSSPPAYTAARSSPSRRFSPSQFDPLPILNPGFSPSDLDLPSPFPNPPSPVPRFREDGSCHSSFTAGSPNLADLLLPGTDMRQPPDPSELRPPMSPLPYQPGLAESPEPPGIAIQEDDDFDEEVIRDPMNIRTHSSDPQWRYRAASPALSDASTTSSRSTNMSILRPPPLDPSSPEMLMLQFDKETCGILSIKDGPSENPWRTLIWPLAKDSHALYHAISSMAALHGATRNPQLRIAGMAHMTKSISRLSAELHEMRLDQALATSLALALGEGWDDKISTGIQHLRGAKTMLNNALVQRHRHMQLGQLTMDEAKRLKFLCNTYVYLDVIARLSSREEQNNIELEGIVQAVNEPLAGVSIVEVDPLMGCATTLFPLIGRVASLIQKVRKTNSNSLNVVSEANELREQILQWQPPNINMIERPEDPQSDVRHAIQTAEAYRRAILLHLHQAVPEIVSEPAHTQAKNILTVLAGTPLSSRTMIVQIFPLLVGSCEMVSIEDRQWVCDRWENMMRRLAIVNVASCWKLVQEVWQRRDMHIQEQARRLSSRTFGRTVPPGLFIPPSLKRKTSPMDAISEDPFTDVYGQGDGTGRDDNGRPLKRRFTFDPSVGLSANGLSNNHVARRHTDVSISNLEPEYTVRGHLHWLCVMSEWNWEVFLG